MFSSVHADHRVCRPRWVWVAVGLELFTALGAVPVGVMLLADTTGSMVGFPKGWIEATIFGSYLVPGLYLLLMNGGGMIATAWLTFRRHWTAPWLTAILGTGLAIWIGVQLVVMPEVSFLQLIFGLTGLALLLLGVTWLRSSATVTPR